MDKILIVGSGASGVHFALSVLKKGYDVTMLDVGYKKPDMINPDDTINDLKMKLDDPVRYFLGKDYKAVIYPDFESEYYGFPPSKDYVFSIPQGFKFRLHGFAPVFSFAQGGLAEAWTGGVYPFNDYDLEDFPFRYKDIEPYYSEVADRIGITGKRDDLERFFPFHKNIMKPLELDEHSKLLLSQYEKHKDYLNNKLKCYMGRSRLAVISMDKGKRKGCSYCGRCIWGCPSEAFYTPSITLNQCRQYPNFRYLPNMFVKYFKFNSGNHVTDIVAESLVDGKIYEFPVQRLVLAAGTLCSSKIFIDSIFKNTGKVIKLHGLMDNRQILMPFINLKMIGKQYNPNSYQYHQLSMELECEIPRDYIDVQITTLKTAMIHPIVQKMFFDLKTAIFMFKDIHAALGIASVSFNNRRSEDNYLTIEPDGIYTRLVINYSLKEDEGKSIKQVIKRVTKALRKLGCIAPAATNYVRPMGANIHYTGTIAMSTKKIRFTTSEHCQSNDFDNLYIVDGTTFPWLPAKNLTFTLMANAVRVAECAF